MNGFSSSAPVWREVKTPEGKTYYHNVQTNATSWTKPEALMTPAERNVSNWKEATDPKSGRKYWYNAETKDTTWTMPEALKNAAAQSQPPQRPPAQAPTFVAGGGTPWAAQQQQQQHQSRDRDDYPGPDRYGSERQSGFGGGDRFGAAPTSRNEPDYSSFEEAESAFMKALKKAGVQPDWDWNQAVRATVKDPQYRALKDPKDRLTAFEKYVVEARAQEKEKERERLAKLRSDFTSMLRSHPEIKHYTRWKTALPFIENESIFRSTKNDEERKQFFEEYIIGLKKAHAEKEASDRKAAIEELTDILQDLNLEPYTRWSTAQEGIQAHDRFQQDEKFRALTKLDILKSFENHVKALERVFNNELQQAKRIKSRKERINRDAFLGLLQDLKSANRLKAGTKWKDIHPLIEDDPRYVAMLGQAGSSAIDLFRDAVEEEERALRSQKGYVLDVLEDNRYELTPKTTIEEFLSVMQTDRRTADIDRDSMALIFERLREKVLRRNEEEKHHSERATRRAIDNLRSLIKHLEPPVSLGDTWDQVRPRLEKYEEYRALDTDDQRRTAFDKHLKRLREKHEDDRDRSRRDHRDRDRDRDRRDKDREYRNGHTDSHRRHRTRTRSPEPDPYEADRRKAMADRETRYRKGGSITGLSPPYRRDRDDRERERDRYDRDRGSRQVSVSHYDRERREREAERERSYVSRADPRDRGSELDYGDSRPGSTRRRRDSGEDSPASRRDSKRVRREVNSRERTFSPRHDRRSRTPAKAVPEPPKEDPGLRSGSEEGEIEED